jgi:hypothetical protein
MAGFNEHVSDKETADAMAAVARNDLATRLGVAPGEISADPVESVVWRSGALGCPQPDRGYTMALTAGYRIRLRHGQAAYEYHAARGGEPFLCPAKRIEAPAQVGDADA